MKKFVISIICIISIMLFFSACGENSADSLTLDKALEKAISGEAQSKVKKGYVNITENISGTESKKEITYEFSAGGNYVYIVEKQGDTTNEYWYSLENEKAVLGIQMYYGQPTVINDALADNVAGYHFTDKFFTEQAFGQAYGVEEMVNNVYKKIATGSKTKPVDGTYNVNWDGDLAGIKSKVSFTLKLDKNYTIVDCQLLISDVAGGDSYTYEIKQDTGARDAVESNSIRTLAAADYSLTLLAPDGSTQKIKDGDTINISPIDNPGEILLFQFDAITPETAVLSIDEPKITVFLADKETDLLNVSYDTWEEVGELYATLDDSINKSGESYMVKIETLRKTLTFNVVVGRAELTVFKPAVSYPNGFGNTILACNEYTLYNTQIMSFGAKVNSFADDGYAYTIKNFSGEKIAEGSVSDGAFTEFKQPKNGKYTIELVSLADSNRKETLEVNVVDTPSISQIMSGKYCTTAIVANGNILSNVRVIIDYSGEKITLTVGDKIFTDLVNRDNDKFNILSDKDDVFRIYSPKDKYYQLFFSYKMTWEDSGEEVFVELLSVTPNNLLTGDVEWIDFSNSWENSGSNVYGFKISFSADGTGKHESNYQDDCEWFYSQFEWSMDDSGNITVVFTEIEFSDIKNISGKFTEDYSTLEITATYNNNSVKTMTLKMLP